MAKGSLDAEAKDLVWRASEMREGELREDIYKALIGAAADMQLEDKAYFVQKIAS